MARSGQRSHPAGSAAGGSSGPTNVIGERWALLIVRDLLVGPQRYGELAAGLQRIPSNVLATRLKELQEAGVLRRAPHSRVVVYELTPYGRELEPLVRALGAWGFEALGDPREGQVLTADAMTMTLRTAFRPEVAAGLPATAYAARFGTAELLVEVDGAALVVTWGSGPADLVFATGQGRPRAAVRRARPGPGARDRRRRAAARRSGLLDRFASTFHLAA